MQSPSSHGDPSARSERLDVLVQSRGWARSRTQAQAYIKAGAIRLPDGTKLDKPSRKLPSNSDLRICEPPRFVARSGEKLEAALEAFALDVRGVIALDVGASTGGFTDCLLQRGAAAIVCVDVGHNQLVKELREHPQVTSHEGLNARDLDSATLEPEKYDLAVIDVSFISLSLVLAPVWRRLHRGGWLIALIKPQFEAGKAAVDQAQGVIRSESTRQACRDKVLGIGDALPLAERMGVIESPIAGGNGNQEYLAAWQYRH